MIIIIEKLGGLSLTPSIIPNETEISLTLTKMSSPSVHAIGGYPPDIAIHRIYEKAFGISEFVIKEPDSLTLATADEEPVIQQWAKRLKRIDPLHDLTDLNKPDLIPKILVFAMQDIEQGQPDTSLEKIISVAGKIMFAIRNKNRRESLNKLIEEAEDAPDSVRRRFLMFLKPPLGSIPALFPDLHEKYYDFFRLSLNNYLGKMDEFYSRQKNKKNDRNPKHARKRLKELGQQVDNLSSTLPKQNQEPSEVEVPTAKRRKRRKNCKRCGYTYTHPKHRAGCMNKVADGADMEKKPRVKKK